jgi:hypothetical protein
MRSRNYETMYNLALTYGVAELSFMEQFDHSGDKTSSGWWRGKIWASSSIGMWVEQCLGLIIYQTEISYSPPGSSHMMRNFSKLHWTWLDFASPHCFFYIYFNVDKTVWMLLIVVGVHERSRSLSPAPNAFCLDTDNSSENPTVFVDSADCGSVKFRIYKTFASTSSFFTVARRSKLTDAREGGRFKQLVY